MNGVVSAIVISNCNNSLNYLRRLNKRMETQNISGQGLELKYNFQIARRIF